MTRPQTNSSSPVRGEIFVVRRQNIFSSVRSGILRQPILFRTHYSGQPRQLRLKRFHNLHDPESTTELWLTQLLSRTHNV
jgi:hypothetical protein